MLRHLVNERHAVRCRAEDWDPLYAFPSLTAEVTNPVNGISHPQYIPTSGSVTEKDLSWIFILKPFFILVEKF